MHDDELTPEERAAMESLPRERPPDRALEERIVRALRAQGLIERPAALRFTIPPVGWPGGTVRMASKFARTGVARYTASPTTIEGTTSCAQRSSRA